MKKPKELPVRELRIGAIKAAIWVNPTRRGVQHSVTFVRLFKKENTWRSSPNFGRDDLLVLARIADNAFGWITDTETAARQNNLASRTPTGTQKP